MRAFIGIKLDDSAIKKIKGYFNYFYSENVTGNFTKLNNLHLTLSFLGEINPNRVEELINVIESMELKIKQIKISKITKLKDMVVGEVTRDCELMSLQDELVKELKLKGFILDKKAFYPHITLIRQVSGGNNLKNFNSNVEIISNVTKITLFESTRINKELIYIPIN